MKKRVPLATCFAVLSLGVSLAFSQGASSRPGSVIIPDTNVQRPSDIGARFHTNYLIFVPGPKLVLSGPSGETPGSLACIYKLVNSPYYPNCAISDATTAPSGGSGIIAVVDAYDYPTAKNDFDAFSTQFELTDGGYCTGAPGSFCKVYATGAPPHKNAGWALEAATDIEWAHAMAPNAQIVLVEADSNSNADLLDAVDAATQIVTCGSAMSCPGNGTGVVSMSWGGSEFSDEASSSYEAHFTTSGIVYTAASGDSALTPIWPSTSPNVLSAGGTTVNRKKGDFTGETAWGDSGGGPSAFENEPDYQTTANPAIGENLNGMRGTPDFSYDADPNTGVSVYDTTRYQGLSGWFVIGGTSVSAQALAGIIDLAGGVTTSHNTQDELGTIYSNYGNTGDFTDITSGTAAGCHPNPHRTCISAHSGWDFLTGVGTDVGTNNK